ncbi:MAG: hypothetical protein SangKO_078820 [Sandaracinaceae bacterium]
MHRLFADWYSRVDPGASPERLHLRWGCVEAFLKDLTSFEVLSATRLFLGLPASTAAEHDDVASRFKEADASVKMLDNQHLIRVLAGAALAECASTEHELRDLAALALRAGTCMNHRNDSPLPEVVEAVQDASLARAVILRQRPMAPQRPKYRFEEPAISKLSDPEFKDIATPQNEAAHLNANFKATQAALAELQETVNSLHASVVQLKKDAKRATDKVADFKPDPRVPVLQEECEVLWWLFAESVTHDRKPLSEHSAPAAALMIGEELAHRTRLGLPLPSTDDFVRRALANTTPANGDSEEATLVEIVEASPKDWRVNRHERSDSVTTQLGSLAPVGQALRLSLDAVAPGGWTGVYEKKAGLSAETKLRPAQWARQLYDEDLLATAVRASEA